jgi:HTH-type transcriptional regulator / antitoxin HigA
MMFHNTYKPESFTHPGVTLREKLDEIGMGAKEFAVRTGKPEKTISAVLNCNSSITPEMAVQFENVLRIPARFWLNYQQKYNEFIAKKKHDNTINNAVEWARTFPYNEMSNFNWVQRTRKPKERAENLLKFFGFSTHIAWEKYFLESKLKAAFRISLKHTKKAPAISAWLRRGEIQAEGLLVPDYSIKKFKDALNEIKNVMAAHPENYAQKLQELSGEAGVKVVYTPCLPKAPINGCTRWINDTPLIQLSGRYQRNDIFWFTFFHEAGHIILHGKKDIFLENVDDVEKDIEKEKEADDFAIDWTLSEQEETEVLENAPLSKNNIIAYAKKFNTHPAIIIGRLQHKKLIDFSIGKEFIEKVELGKL